MEQKKIVPMWLSVLLVILIVATIIRTIVLIPSGISNGNGFMFVIIKGLECLTYVFTLGYCFKNYKKNAALMFKLFCLTYALFALSAIYGKIVYMRLGVSSILPVISSSIICITLFVFTFVKNLGRKISYILAAVILTCEIINLLCVLNMDFGYITTILGRIILAVIFGIMVYAKYQDKSARGTD